MILMRDLSEVGVILLMLPLWFYLGYRLSLPLELVSELAGHDWGWRVHSGGPKTPSAEAQ